MNVWNTILTKSATQQLDYAIFVLETLSDPVSIPILEYLQEHQSATLLDLTVHTGFDSLTLENQLEALCATKAVWLDTDIYRNLYCIDEDRLQQVSRIAKLLVNA